MEAIEIIKREVKRLQSENQYLQEQLKSYENLVTSYKEFINK